MWRELGLIRQEVQQTQALVRAPELCALARGPTPEEHGDGHGRTQGGGEAECVCCGARSWEGVQREQRYLEGGLVSPVLCLPSTAPHHLKKFFLIFPREEFRGPSSLLLQGSC